MELNREQVVKALEKWMKNYDGNVANFVTLGNAIRLIEKLDDENKRLQELASECQQYNEAWVEDNGKLRKHIKTIREEAVRKMKDKLINYESYDNGGGNYVVSVDDIRTVAKEILGEE